jgi:glycosyltransferase involved in cell wall biosynthesis
LTYHTEKFEEVFSGSPDLQKNIFLKKVSQDQVFNELRRCSFGILIRKNNLINRVSSPLKFAEYLSAGLPVLISEGVGDTETFVKTNNIGVIVKDNDYLQAHKKMKDLLSDPEVHSRCRQLAEKEYDINISFNQYMNIYKNLSKP